MHVLGIFAYSIFIAPIALLFHFLLLCMSIEPPLEAMTGPICVKYLLPSSTKSYIDLEL